MHGTSSAGCMDRASRRVTFAEEHSVHLLEETDYSSERASAQLAQMGDVERREALKAAHRARKAQHSAAATPATTTTTTLTLTEAIVASKMDICHDVEAKVESTRSTPPTVSSQMEDVDWGTWLSVNIDSTKVVDEDYGLAKIAAYLGKSEALELYWQGMQKEDGNDVNSAISIYKKAFRMWPALDSITLGGLPQGVRHEAQNVEGNVFASLLMDCVDVQEAQASRVMHSIGLLGPEDLHCVEAVRKQVLEGQDEKANNPQNATHAGKKCVFLNGCPSYRIYHDAPAVIGKMLRFAQQAWEEEDWGGRRGSTGPLRDIAGGVPSLSIRVVEHWTYVSGGGLVDNHHYDTDSVLTIVCLLSDANDFEGGCFRTFEADGTHTEHRMQQGDVICLLSHKYHNVTPVLSGQRRSLVMELWQGGVGQMGR